MEAHDGLYDLDSLRLYKQLVESHELQLRLIAKLSKNTDLDDELDELRKAVGMARKQLNEMIDPSQARDV